MEVQRTLLRRGLQVFLLLLTPLGLLQPGLLAQDFAPASEVATNDASAALTWTDYPAMNDQGHEDQQDQGQKSKKRKIPEGLIVAPIPISSPAIGTGAVLVGVYILPF